MMRIPLCRAHSRLDVCISSMKKYHAVQKLFECEHNIANFKKLKKLSSPRILLRLLCLFEMHGYRTLLTPASVATRVVFSLLVFDNFEGGLAKVQ